MAALVVPQFRRRCREFALRPDAGLCAAVLCAFFLMMLAVSVLFAAKYNFARLERYYLPVRPLYLVLFVAPILWASSRRGRALGFSILAVMASWIAQVDGLRAYARASDRSIEATPYGALAEAFTPGAAATYRWLSALKSDELVVVSNFHEYILLETGIPALPVPPDRNALDEWISRICAERRVANVDVFFVLDPRNRWRDYWLPAVESVISNFRLDQRVSLPPESRRTVRN
jgi:hypothetical protein